MFFKGDPNDRAYVREITEKLARRITELSRESGQRLAARQMNKPAFGSATPVSQAAYGWFPPE